MKTMETATKTSLENKHFGNSDYVVIIASFSHLLFLTEHATNGLNALEAFIGNEKFTVVCFLCR